MASDNPHDQHVTPDGYNQVQSFSISYGPLRYEPVAPKKPAAESGSRPLKKAIKSAGEFVQGLRTLFFNVLFLGLVLFLITLAIYFAFSRNQIVIETITVPKPLLAIGYTEEVAAHRLSDAIKEIEQAVWVRRPALEVLTEAQQVDIKIPEVGTLFDTALYYAKVMFSNQDTTVAGEFICGSADCGLADVYLRLRVFGERPTTVNLPAIRDAPGIAWEDHYFRQAALGVLSEVQPYFVAAYYIDRDPGQTRRIARSILRAEQDAKNEALVYNMIGVSHLHEGRYDDAIGFFRKALTKDDRLVEAHSNWGNALLGKSRYDEAVEKYDDALRIDPAYAAAHSNIGDALLRQNQIGPAIAQYEKAIEIDSENAYAYVNLGSALTRHGDARGRLGEEEERRVAYDRAFTQFRDAVEVNPHLVLAHVTWADALIKVDRYDAAKQKIEDGLRIVTERDVPNRSKTLAGLHGSLGDLEVRRGNDPAAIIAYRKALAARSDFTRAWSGLGDAMLRKKDYAEALSAFREAVKYRPDHVNALIGMGDAHYHQKDYAAAGEAYQKAVDFKEDAFRAHEGLGNVAFRQKDYDLAVNHYTSATGFYTAAINSHAGLGLSLARSGDLQAGVVSYLEALRINATVPYIRNDFLAVVGMLPDWQSANDALTSATSIAPDQAPFYRSWIEISEKHGRQEAYPAILAVWRDNTGSPEPWVLLGEHLLAQNNTEQAISAFRAALDAAGESDDPFVMRARAGLSALEPDRPSDIDRL